MAGSEGHDRLAVSGYLYIITEHLLFSLSVTDKATEAGSVHVGIIYDKVGTTGTWLIMNMTLWSEVACTKMVKFGRVVSEICERTNRHHHMGC